MAKATLDNHALTQRRWLVLISSCLINLCIGALYVWSVFSGPMAEHLNTLNGTALTAASLAIVFSIGNGDGFITLIAGGAIQRKFGPRVVVLAGGILFGLGFIICGLATSVGMLILGYGVVSGLAMGLAYGVTISNSVKFFPDKAGLIGGIATASYGISSVVIPPVANLMINLLGVCTSFIVFGVFVVIVVGIFAQFILPCPDGFVPEGWTPPAAKKGAAVPDKDWRGMLRTPVFYVMIVMLFFGAVFGMMSISQASNVAQSMISLSAASAAVVVSVLALFNTFGRIIAGYISDRIGSINTLTSVFVLAIIALVLLYVSGTGIAVLFYVGICLIGLCFGAFMGVYPAFTASQFGSKNSGVNYGIMFIGFSSAGIIGPMIMSRVFSATGSYRPAFLIATVLAAIGLVLSFVFRAVSKKR